MALDTTILKTKLEEELKELESQLSKIGRRNPNNPEDWEAVQGETNADTADRNEVADNIEQYEENTGILKELETRFNNVKLAISKIDDGTYGKCEISGGDIDEDRLIANPAARTCKKHIEEEV